MKKENPNTAEVRQFLQSYLYNSRMLRGNRYARTYFGNQPESEKTVCDDPFIKAAMHTVRHFVLTLPDRREKMFLYYRYLCGYTVEKCAEIMEVSTRTAFRIAADALIFAAENYPPR